MTRMPKPEKDRPVIVDGDQDDLARISDELKTRYGGHYDVMCMSSTSEGKDALDNLTNTGRNVALVLADRGRPRSASTKATLRPVLVRLSRASLPSLVDDMHMTS